MRWKGKTWPEDERLAAENEPRVAQKTPEEEVLIDACRDPERNLRYQKCALFCTSDVEHLREQKPWSAAGVRSRFSAKDRRARRLLALRKIWGMEDAAPRKHHWGGAGNYGRQAQLALCSRAQPGRSSQARSRDWATGPPPAIKALLSPSAPRSGPQRSAPSSAAPRCRRCACDPCAPAAKARRRKRRSPPSRPWRDRR